MTDGSIFRRAGQIGFACRAFLLQSGHSMRRIRTFFIGFAAAFAVAASVEAAEWVELFNGRNLDGWTQRGGKASYEAVNGEIVGKSVPRTPNSFLCTTRDYTNFILELEFKVATNLNSGIQIRSQAFDERRKVERDGKTYDIPAGRVHGYQVEIDPSARAWTGGIYDEGRRGWLADLKENEAGRKAFRQGEWNRLRVEARGPLIKTWVNGVQTAELRDDMTPSGFIALQVHGVGDRTDPLEVRWRNIRIQELP
jgi:hypothetical protein